ncbi:MAG: hypothetical protein Q9159_001775 [Coniocarpon cinnabarinum]
MSVESNKTTGEFRAYLPDLTTPRFVDLAKSSAHDHVQSFHQYSRPPWLKALYDHWQRQLEAPFKGVTTDGHVRPGLFHLQDEGVEIENIVASAQKLMGLLDDAQRTKLCYHVDSPAWRTWSNPEFLFSNKGIRLDEVDQLLQDAALNVLKASLSPEGYDKARSAMRVNHFLGELCNGSRVMNEYSYNIVFFGKPSTSEAWGWSFYGHHLCLNAFFSGRQVVLSPWFTGAEPNEIDRGPHAGLKIMRREETAGLKLMQQLGTDLQRKAQLFKLMKDPSMPRGRWNHDDQRHLLGAYQDNRIVPNEGVRVGEMGLEQQALVLDILDAYLLYLPKRSREMQLDRCRGFFDETFFCWIGGFSNSDPFYFRLQSPVMIVEFDHHSGVFLANEEPAKFHIHTILRK